MGLVSTKTKKVIPFFEFLLISLQILYLFLHDFLVLAYFLVVVVNFSMLLFIILVFHFTGVILNREAVFSRLVAIFSKGWEFLQPL